MTAIIIRRIIGAIVFIVAAVAGYHLSKKRGTPSSGKRSEGTDRTVNNLVIGGEGEGHLRTFKFNNKER